jgi:hypothetical protein
LVIIIGKELAAAATAAAAFAATRRHMLANWTRGIRNDHFQRHGHPNGGGCGGAGDGDLIDVY